MTLNFWTFGSVTTEHEGDEISMADMNESYVQSSMIPGCLVFVSS